MSINDGGPAYPVTQFNNDAGEREVGGGMSPRDHFAGLAMQAIISLGAPLTRGQQACDAYEYADAMLAERERGR